MPRTSTDECPTSFITADSIFLLELLSEGTLAQNAGGTLFGQDASLWPAWYVDAVAVCERAKAEVELIRDQIREEHERTRKRDARH